MKRGRTSPYDSRFFSGQGPESAQAAKKVLPPIISALNATSVVDVGCGTGGWLAAAKDAGVTRIQGLDGSDIADDQLQVSSRFRKVVDLTNPPSVTETYDLAICLEVAEHLPEDAADRLVGFLCELAPIVLFGAAVPGQGGTGHINEQWPSYWASLFARHSRVPVELVRPEHWEDATIPYWYRQNTLTYVTRDSSRLDSNVPVLPLDLVHPEMFLREQGLGLHLRRLPQGLRTTLKTRFGR